MVHVAAFSRFCPWPGATSSLWKYSNSPQTGGTALTPLPTHKPGKTLNTMNQMVSFPCYKHFKAFPPHFRVQPILVHVALADQDLGHALPLSHSPFFLLLQPHWPSFSSIPSLFAPHPPRGLCSSCSSARASPP